jgi:hypothetical protein
MSARETMNELNPNALHAQEGAKEVFIEDVQDPDGRWYRIEYQCNPDGTNARAKVAYNPWGSNTYSYLQSHLSSSGDICLGTGMTSTSSPYDLKFAVQRARFWCTGYSFLRENGYDRTRHMIPEW